MAKSLRWSEKWFNRGLWLVAVIFASFLISLGSAVVDDLPQVEQRLERDHFVDDRARWNELHQQLNQANSQEDQAESVYEQQRLQWEQARSDTKAAQDSLENWIASRTATQRAEQNDDVVLRTQALDLLRATERQAQQKMQDQRQIMLNARQQAQQLREHIRQMADAADVRLHEAQRAQELRVFLYRLALTLPLLVVAGWLFVRKRKSPWWPFVWGFIFFAVFAFFVELVPYLPSYGGYVRSVVGIAITALVGRWVIVALQRYLERKRQEEQLPAHARQVHKDYDAVLVHVSKGVCPGCERSVDFKDGITDFCPHCGLCLFAACTQCQTRKSAFTKFCYHCGSHQEVEQAQVSVTSEHAHITPPFPAGPGTPTA